MYGRIFESLYEGSMVGKGSPMFAVWCYVIAKMRPDKEVGAQVNLNPALLCHILGEEEGVVREVIEELCRPDPRSNDKDKEGRRLVKLGEFAYQVVNGAKYAKIKNLEEKREHDRNRKASERANAKAGVKLKGKSKPSGGETQFVEMIKNGEDVSMEPGNRIPLPSAPVMTPAEESAKAYSDAEVMDAELADREREANEEEMRRLREDAG